MTRSLPIVLILALIGVGCAVAPRDRLPSGNDGAVKSAITDFVDRVTDPAGADFVPEAERIAVFDNDGTLWAEEPTSVQLTFAMDRVRALAPEDPEWASQQPDKAVLEMTWRRCKGPASTV